MIKNILAILLLTLFLGCEVDLFNDQKLEQLQKENATLKAQQEADSLKLEHKSALVKLENTQALEKLKLEGELKKTQLNNDKETTLAEIAKSREIEKLALDNALKKEQLIQDQAKALELIRQKTALVEAEKALELKKYLFGVVALLLLITAFFIYYYLKRKREDKLIAYNDNLKKYFHFKENETRTRIAEKVLDTIAAGKLSTEDQVNLLKAISSTAVEEQRGTTQVEQIESIDVEMIEDKSK